MSHHDNHHHIHEEEKKSINFWAPLIGGLVIWMIALIIETNLDEKPSHHSDQKNIEQTETSHH
ncbi:MAG: hypothetical protein N2203_02805 [Bacteroidia bacterium]|nr:hypothetical protein [Bacteroidia bacterium]